MRIYTTLVEGKVSVDTDKHIRNLEPGEQSIYDIETETMDISEVDIYNETSWKDGIFSFERMPLRDII